MSGKEDRVHVWLAGWKRENGFKEADETTVWSQMWAEPNWPYRLYKPTSDKPHQTRHRAWEAWTSSHGSLSPDAVSSSRRTIEPMAEVPEQSSGCIKTAPETQAAMKGATWLGPSLVISPNQSGNPTRKCAPAPDQGPGLEDFCICRTVWGSQFWSPVLSWLPGRASLVTDSIPWELQEDTNH